MKMRMVLIAAAILCQACLNQKDGHVTETATNPEEGPLSVFDVNIYSLNKVVCDPFDDSQNPGPNDGLIATLFYRGQGQPEFAHVQDYVDQGIRSSKNLFFSTLNVPTRKFELGFPTQTGGMVKNDMGEDLNEYFALRFSSILKLSEQDEEGLYEFALLSDDGSVMKVRQEDGNYKTIVNNDFLTPTRMGCGDRIQMSRQSELLVQLDYYQGPRYHISLIPIWRKVSASTPADPLCGHSGNSLFFDYQNNSAPQQAWFDLQSRGWKAIAAANWNLPAFAIFNPCTNGKTPVISNFKVVSNVEGVVVLTWNTDIPATSQILFKNINYNDSDHLTEADNHLRKDHQVVVYGNVFTGQTYDFQAISISADYGKAISDPIRLLIK